MGFLARLFFWVANSDPRARTVVRLGLVVCQPSQKHSTQRRDLFSYEHLSLWSGPCSEETRRGLWIRTHILRRIRELSRRFPCQRPPSLRDGSDSLFHGRSLLEHRLREHRQHRSWRYVLAPT